jgi:hypothetical protein
MSSLTLALSPASLGTERWLWQPLAAAQLFFYAVALLGRRAGRIGGLARTFVVLNAAAVVGLWRFLRKSQHIAW